MSKICIITPAYIYGSPRVVKEADALWEAGHDVRVVFSSGNLEHLVEMDAALVRQKPWRYNTVKWSPSRKEERKTFVISGIRHNICKRLPYPGLCFGRLAEMSEGRVYHELAALASSEPADMYIGHYPVGLAAAWRAARRWKARLGYDAEDLYADELLPRKRQRVIGLIEKRYLPDCSYVSTASELFTAEIKRRYSRIDPVTVHNVFSLSDRQKMDGMVKDRKGAGVSLYWYSQTIGEGRGIEDIVKAGLLLRDDVEIHLRGILSGEYRQKITAMAEQNRCGGRLYMHAPVPPDALLSRAAEHDIGLALEQPVSLSKELCVSNKIGLYYLAGIAVAATDLPGQRYALKDYPEAGFLYKPGDYRALARNINKLASDPQLLRNCKETALKAAYEKWNWETEKEKLIGSVIKVLDAGT
ncbi:MAG: glycosyltransferase [Candidatus Omnitrophota bacterium]